MFSIGSDKVNKIETYFFNKGFKVEKGAFSGVLNDFEVIGAINPYNTNVQLIISFYFDKSDEDLIHQDLMDSDLLQDKKLYVEIAPGGIYLSVSNRASKIIELMEQAMDEIFKILSNYNVKGHEYCPYCGELHDETSTRESDFSIRHHSECLDKINEEIKEERKKEQEEFNNKPLNLGRGILGALLGGLIACAIGALLTSTTTIGSILCAYVSVALGMFFYKKFGGKEIIVMNIIILITSLSFSFLAVKIGTIMMAVDMYKDYKMFDAYTLYMSDPANAKLYYIILGVTLGLTLLFNILKLVPVIIDYRNKKNDEDDD